MDNLDFQDAALLGFDFDPAHQQRYQQQSNQAVSAAYHFTPLTSTTSPASTTVTSSATWPLPPALAMAASNHASQQQQQQHHQQHHAQDQQHQHQQQHHSQRRSQTIATTSSPQAANSLVYSQAMDTAALLSTNAGWLHLQATSAGPQYMGHPTALDLTSLQATYGDALQASPTDLGIPVSQALLNSTLTIDPAAFTTMPMASPLDALSTPMAFHMDNFHQDLEFYQHHEYTVAPSSIPGSSPADTLLEIRSLSEEGSWIDVASNRNSFDGFNNDAGYIFNPERTLHNRADSSSSHHSDMPSSAHSTTSWEDLGRPFPSPQSELALDFSASVATTMPGIPIPALDHQHHHHYQHLQYNYPIALQPSVSPPAMPADVKVPIQPSASPSSSGSSSGSSTHSSPSQTKKRLSKTGPTPNKVTKPPIAKKPAHSTCKDNITEKKVGRRRGPLRPDQRQQAHEIRKLRACLRCKFLKKTCDKGDPCGGCQPSHARLWQVPCTRIDIKDIAYFMKDWKADYERHVSLGFSVGNIKGFAKMERPLYVTHGYGFFLPISAREIYVRDDNCFGVDWIETMHISPRAFEVNTAKLSAGKEGISHALLTEYLDRHLDGGFERFVDEYFEGTYFVTEILKTAYRFYLREKLPVLRKALKLVIAYTLTVHVTMVEGLSDEEAKIGKVLDEDSKYYGKTFAPVMINFQVKCALADMWRELQKEVLEELSHLYQSVYSGDKLKNWPTIFMLAAILLSVWELMQFDCHFRVSDQTAAQKFCSDMEGTPVGVIVGLFSAISQKLPSFFEWDTRQHQHLLNSNPAVCDAMTEVRAHVTKYESYLRSRSETKFDREDFDCLSNKFLSKLVIRAN